MVVQMLLCLHGIYSQLALDGRSCEYIHTVALIENVVGDMLNNCRGFLIVDQHSGLDDKFLRIVLKLVKYVRLDTLKDSNNCFSGKTGLVHQLSDEVILYIRVCRDGHTIAGRLFFYKRGSGNQLLLGLDIIHRTGFYQEVNL